MNDIYKIIKGIKKMPWFLGMHVFWVIILLILIDLFVGLLLFYKYVYLAENKKLEINSSKIIILNENKYQAVLRYWDERKEAFDNLEVNNVRNIFK